MRTPSKRAWIWLDGEFIPSEAASLPLGDETVQAGLGVFETLAVRTGRILDLDAHLNRLENGAGRLVVPVPDRVSLVRAMREVAAGLDGDYAWLKVIACRSGTLAVFGNVVDAAEVGAPATAILLRWRLSPRNPLAGTKSLNYAAYVLGAEEAARRGADEGLWCNTRGHLAEGCSSNVLVVRRRKIYTAGLSDGVLPGTVRDLALRAARDLGVAVHEGKVRLKRLERADEAFLTSSVRGVRPLVRFQGKPVGRGRPGPVTRAIAERVEQLRVIDRPTGETGEESPAEDARVSGPTSETV